MKTDEILNEGPLWSGLKGLVTPGKTMSGEYHQAAGDQYYTNLAKRAMPLWKQQVAGDTARGIVPDPKRLQQWATKTFGVALPEFRGMLDDNAILDYFKAAYAKKYSEVDDPAAVPAEPAPAEPAPAEPAPAEPAPAEPAAPTEPAPAVPTEPVPAEPTPALPAEPAPAERFDTTQFTEKLKTDWAAFVDSGRPASQELRRMIKQMWLDTGGVKAESKKSKLSNIIKESSRISHELAKIKRAL